MTRTDQTVAIEHVLRVDNQSADGQANRAMDKRLHTEEPLLLVAPTAVARFSRNFEIRSNIQLPAVLESAPSRQRHLPNVAPGRTLGADIPLVSMDHPSWNFLRGFGASVDTLVGFQEDCNVRTVGATKIPLDRFTNAFKLLPHVPISFLIRTPVRSTKALSYTRPCRNFFSPRRSLLASSL